MRVEKRNYHKIVLTGTERMAFGLVDSILAKIQSDYSEYWDMESQLTGEVVPVKEIARLRGALSFFSEPNQIFECKLRDEK